MHRFYCPHANFKQSTIVLTDRDEIRHIKDVLRLKKGDEIHIFNSQSQQARTVIEAVKESGIEARIMAVQEGALQNIKIILACAVPKKAKFEFIIEKCTELGVHTIIPLQTKRTEVIFSADKRLAKQTRFQKVAVNAAKQSGRMDIPHIHPVTTLPEAFKLLDSKTLIVIPSLNGQPQQMRDVLGNPKGAQAIAVFIGPEGDFTPDEICLAAEHGALPVSLGTTVLKVDTAAITTVAFIRFLLYN